MEIIQYEFFQKAIVALILVSIVSGIIGTLIVVKKISMVSGSIAHGAFGGLGIAYYLGFSPLFGAMTFSVIGALIISFISEKFRQYLDSILTIFWAGGMAIGLLFVFITPGYASDLFSYLFGNVLLIGNLDLFIVLGVSILVLISIAAFYKQIVATLFNEEFAKLKGINSKFIFGVFMVLIALAVVLLIKTVGIVLTLAMFTISPALAIKYVNSVDRIMILSATLNIITALSGLFIAYLLALPTAPVIIILQIIVFGIGMLLREKEIGLGSA